MILVSIVLKNDLIHPLIYRSPEATVFSNLQTFYISKFSVNNHSLLYIWVPKWKITNSMKQLGFSKIYTSQLQPIFINLGMKDMTSEVPRVLRFLNCYFNKTSKNPH
jgi:hypothetical protein